VPQDVKEEVEGKVQVVRTALQGTDIEEVRKATQELNETMQKVGQAVYQQQTPPPKGEAPPGDEQPPADEGEGTVEGEFREV